MYGFSKKTPKGTWYSGISAGGWWYFHRLKYSQPPALSQADRLAIAGCSALARPAPNPHYRLV